MIPALVLMVSSALAATPAELVTIESLKWYVQNHDFKPVEPARWVYDGVQKAFVGLDMSDPKSIAYVDELVKMGVTVMHTGGPAPYCPYAGPAGQCREVTCVSRAQQGRSGTRQ